MNGAELMVQALRSAGITFVSVLAGNGTNPFMHACQQAGIRVVDTRNEQTAAYMADATGRLTRRVGVCAVSASVGHANALIGCVNAYFDGSPMLLISGESPAAESGLGKFQEMPEQVAMAAPVCKYARRVVEPEKLAFYLHEALTAAVSGRPGPVHLTVPMDVFEAPVDPARVPHAPPSSGVVEQHAPGDPALIRRAAQWLAEAQKPLCVAGSGAFYAEAGQALAEFAALTDVPIVTPIWDRGVIERPVPQFLGVIGAASGGPPLLPDVDLILILGATPDYRLGYLQPPRVREEARVIRVDVDPQELRRRREPDLAILGDVRSVLEGLNEAWRSLGTKPKGSWLQEARRRDRNFRRRWLEVPAPPAPMTGRHVVDTLRPFVARDDLLFLVDGGNIGQWAHMALCDRYPSRWLTCGASGVVGWGMGGAIATKLAYPDRPVLLLSGDGSFGFNIADLETAVRHDTPFVVVLADDQAWGIVVSGQEKTLGKDCLVGCQLGPVRYDLVAEGFGCRGVRAESPQAISQTIEEALAADCVTVIQVPIAVLAPSDVPE
ncbi:MAG: thiamine pyrophosphate-binding protein [Anaerolineae bacterium]